MYKPGLKSLTLLVILLTLLAACTPTPAPENGETGTLHFDPEQLPDAQIDHPYSVTIVISGGSTPVGDIYLESGNLPTDFTLEKIQSEDKAVISGTATVAGTFEFTIGAWCFGTNQAGDQGSKVYTIVVSK